MTSCVTKELITPNSRCVLFFFFFKSKLNAEALLLNISPHPPKGTIRYNGILPVYSLHGMMDG